MQCLLFFTFSATFVAGEMSFLLLEYWLLHAMPHKGIWESKKLLTSSHTCSLYHPYTFPLSRIAHEFLPHSTHHTGFQWYIYWTSSLTLCEALGWYPVFADTFISNMMLQDEGHHIEDIQWRGGVKYLDRVAWGNYFDFYLLGRALRYRSYASTGGIQSTYTSAISTWKKCVSTPEPRNLVNNERKFVSTVSAVPDHV